MKYLSAGKLGAFLEKASEKRKIYVPVDEELGKSSY